MRRELSGNADQHSYQRHSHSWRNLIRPRNLFLALALSSALACSPGYVIRAGWEEAGILLRRESIQTLVEEKQTDEETRRKLKLVLEAREFAKTLGLAPKGSFSQFTKIDREVLLWVLTGADKTSLEPVTWWFPIVGSVPYKGFFEKDDAFKEAESLRKKEYDIYLRPSPAFSTLGWFDDPLLSTTLKSDDLDLVNTVIHEILHNTLWVSGQVPFNETTANFIGSRGAFEFFRQKHGSEHPLTLEAERSWQDQIVYARFLAETTDRLKKVYEDSRSQKWERKLTLERREEIFAWAKEEWKRLVPTLRTKRFLGAAEKLNNAVILAHLTYFQSPWHLESLYEACGRSLPKVVEELKGLEETSGFSGEPFRFLQERVTILQGFEKNVGDASS